MSDKQNLIKNKYTNLPKIVQDYLDSDALEEQIYEIGQSNKLHIDQIGDLDDIVSLTIMGIVDRRKFQQEMIDILEIEEKQAENIAREINEKIFKYINEVLRQTSEENPETEEMILNEDKKTITDTISNPTFIPTPSRTYEKEIPEAVTIEKKLEVEVPSAPLPNTESSPYEMKLSQTTQSTGQTKDINIKDRSSLIPNDHKEKINSDPYKESVE